LLTHALADLRRARLGCTIVEVLIFAVLLTGISPPFALLFYFAIFALPSPVRGILAQNSYRAQQNYYLLTLMQKPIVDRMSRLLDEQA
jgi:hypothetical protein